MGKIKTIKAVAKRIKITKTNKIIKKAAGQNHFNSRETGKTTRQKRNHNTVGQATAQNINKFIPYN